MLRLCPRTAYVCTAYSGGSAILTGKVDKGRCDMNTIDCFVMFVLDLLAPRQFILDFWDNVHGESWHILVWICRLDGHYWLTITNPETGL